jgi:ATP-dependent 26S proteasome regulatory subunit
MSIEMMKHSLQYNLINKFTSNNVLYDSIITIIIIGLISYMNNSVSNSISKVLNPIIDIISSIFFRKYKYRIKITGTKHINKYNDVKFEFSNTFKAIFYYMKNNLSKFNDLYNIIEIITEKKYDYSEQKNEYEFDCNYICDDIDTFEITKDIFLKVIISNENESEKKNSAVSRKQEFSIYLMSNKKNIYALTNFINDLQKKFLENKDINNLNKILYLSLHRYDDEFNNLIFAEYTFVSNTYFKNLFFEQKEHFLEQYNFFLNNENYYKRLGLPYRLGILLHGYPGCGKTSLVKAIANHTKRHIISININKIKNIACLEDVFFNEEIEGCSYKIPINKRIYLISEFDANGSSFLKDRKINYDKDYSEDEEKEEKEENSEINKNNTEIENDNLLIKTLKDGFKSNCEINKDEEKITLGNFLETLDGCMECSGRIIIFTTNNIKKIDPALLRPGRIDINIKFNKCSMNDIINIYEHFFEGNYIDNYIEKIKDRFESNKYSHAEIINIFKKNFMEQKNIFIQ